MINLKGKDFLKLLDFTSEEIEYLIDLAAELKVKKKSNIPHKMCEGKNIALILFGCRGCENSVAEISLIQKSMQEYWLGIQANYGF